MSGKGLQVQLKLLIAFQVNGDIPPRLKKSAHEIILEFIRSRPPLNPVSNTAHLWCCLFIFKTTDVWLHSSNVSPWEHLEKESIHIYSWEQPLTSVFDCFTNTLDMNNIMKHSCPHLLSLWQNSLTAWCRNMGLMFASTVSSFLLLLRQVSARKLKPHPPRPQSLHERLLEDIKAERTLRPVSPTLSKNRRHRLGETRDHRNYF